MTPVRRRADAQRSIDMIIDASRSILSARPDASMEELANAAGVTRQTVYAHFRSRDALITAVFDSVLADAVATIDEADLDALAPPVALRRFLDITDQLIRRHPILLEPNLNRIGTSAGNDPHEPFSAVLERLTRRGQQSGAFDRDLPARWLVAATFSLTHTAAEHVTAGRLTQPKAATILNQSVLRLYGLTQTAPPDGSRPVGIAPRPPKPPRRSEPARTRRPDPDVRKR